MCFAAWLNFPKNKLIHLARRVGMSADEIVPVEDAVVVREDPVKLEETYA
jgi:hypothetical protein